MTKGPVISHRAHVLAPVERLEAARRERWPMGDWVVRNDVRPARAGIPRMRDRDRPVVRPAIPARVTVVDAARATTHDDDADDRADCLAYATETAATRPTTHATVTGVGRRRCAPNRRRTRRDRHVRRCIDRRSRSFLRRLRLWNVDRVRGFRVRRLRDLGLVRGYRARHRFAYAATFHRATGSRRLDRRYDARLL